MILVFDITRIPRTTSREDWKSMDRWRRLTEKLLKKETEERINNLVAYGTTHPELASRMIDRIINPLLLLGPHQ